MPLNNAQYEELMRTYDEIRERHRHELEARTEEIAAKIPGIALLNDRIGSASLEAAKKRILDPKADLSAFYKELEEIADQRIALLQEHGYPGDYLNPTYDCPLCHDTGLVDGKRCSCFRKKEAALLYKDSKAADLLEKENFRHFSFDWYSDTIKSEATGRSARETAEDAVKKARLFLSRIGEEDNNLFISKNIPGREEKTVPIHVDINIVNNDVLDIEKFKAWRPEFANARFELEDGKYICGWEIEKMSKSMYNVQNPDDLVARYGADTLRLYEMFLGPVEQAKPWDTNGIEGVFRFLKKFWKLFENCSDVPADKASLKLMHQTVKKITDDIERFSFNTSVSTFMICVNDLLAKETVSKEVMECLSILLAPFAPHIAEEVYSRLGHDTSVCCAAWPEYDAKMLEEDTFTYPVSFNGKMRFTLDLPAGVSQQDAIAAVKADGRGQKWLDGKEPKRIVFVPNKIINIVV